MGEVASSGARLGRRELLMGAGVALAGCAGLRGRGAREITGTHLGNHGGPVNVVAIAGDSRCAVSADGGLTPHVYVWDLRTRRATHTLLAPGPARALALVEERNAVLVAGWNRQESKCFLSVLDLDTGRSVKELEPAPTSSSVEHLHAVGDARVLASYTERAEPMGSTLWDCDSGTIVRRSPYNADALAADRRTALDGRMLWDLETTTVRATLPGRGAAYGIALSEDGALIVTKDWGAPAALWTADGTRVRTFDDQPSALSSGAFSRNGRLLLTASDLPAVGPRKNALVLRDASNGRAVARLPGHRDHPRAVAFSPDSRLALSGDRGGAVYLWTLNV